MAMRIKGLAVIIVAVLAVSGCLFVCAEDTDADTTTTYSFTLKYSAGMGTGAPETQTYSGTASSHVFTVSSTEPTRTGFTFLGWALTSDATTATIQGGSYITVQAGQTVTLYAVWQQLDSHTATVDDVQSIIADFFDGNEEIAGIIILIAIMALVFAVFRTMSSVLIVMVPATLVLSLMGVLSVEVVVILIIVAVLGLALVARDAVRSRRYHVKQCNESDDRDGGAGRDAGGHRGDERGERSR